MTRSSVVALLACLLAAPLGAQQPDPRLEPGAVAPLLEGLGSVHFPITTNSERAQRFFDQGLRLSYAFNHPEALRAFKEAQRLDPKCAMCYWGEGLVLGPNINSPTLTKEQERDAWAAARQADRFKKAATAVERALIQALGQRYARKGGDRATLDRAYADAMAAAAATHLDDLDVQSLYAESLMDLTPWAYWTQDGAPTQHTTKIMGILESVLARDPKHTGAIHFYIHTVEAGKPDLALPGADRLGDLAPSAGHLVHMPAHIYIRTGHYLKAAEANVRAIAADENYIEQCRAQGTYPAYLYPHNIHFLWAAASFEGRSGLALESARKMASKLTPEHTCGPASVQDWAVVPYYALVRFGRWQEILDEKPLSEKAYAAAIRAWARGMALANLGRGEEAQAELRALEKVQASAEIQQDVVGFDKAATVLEIPKAQLAGEIARQAGRLDEAIAAFQKAVEVQDGLRYNEPPEWHQPMRHVLGSALVQARRYADAERVYREDLKENRENGWALYGLLQALRGQRKHQEAREVDARFRKAWERADVALTASRF
ncbi:MAG: hypothetical protein AB7O37_11445 [Vicinamibacteria bacterium]